MKKAFTLIELLIVVAIIAILAAIAVPNFLEAQTRSKVSRAKTDMRSLATAIESYMVDNNTYPMAARSGRAVPGYNAVNGCYNAMATACEPAKLAASNLNEANSFALQGNTGRTLNTLTTPVAFITAYPADVFKDTKGATFYYYTNGPLWALWSPGPDTDQAIGGQLTTVLANPAIETIFAQWASYAGQIMLTGYSTGTGGGAYCYDATNGTTSKGDIYRASMTAN